MKIIKSKKSEAPNVKTKTININRFNINELPVNDIPSNARGEIKIKHHSRSSRTFQNFE